nr:unnamed protein product [Callosobruchus analis]
MALIGNIEPFSGVTEEFEVYLVRMEHLFRVNCVEDALRVSMFVTLAGSKNLVAPTKPSDLTYVQITGLLRKHYSPPVSEIYERFIFNKCNQKPDQSIADYIVELRKLASSCRFGHFLDGALRDRQLLSDDKPSFKTACQKAQAAELAEKQVKDLASSTDNPINVVQRYPGKGIGCTRTVGELMGKTRVQLQDGSILHAASMVMSGAVRYTLNTISEENIKVVGEGLVQVKCRNKEVKLPLIVVESRNEFTPLLGRNWLDILFPNWQHGFKVNKVYSLDKSVIIEASSKEYSLVFEKKLCDPIRSFEVKFYVKDDAKPVVKKAYDMPYALKPKVEKKIKQMVQVGI